MGFDPEFLPGHTIPLPQLAERVRNTAFNAGEIINHTRYSLVFNQERGFAAFTAHNIDGAALLPAGSVSRRDRFRPDPQITPALQVDNERGYSNNPWDRGHLVRRRSLHWGEPEVARQADSESFFWSNIAPQHKRLHATAWGKIEDWMLDLADDDNNRAAVFTGPVFTPDDPEHQNRPDELPIRIPAGFWKILVIKRHDKLRAAAFLVWQRDFDRERPVTFDPILEQVRMTTIEFLTGLSFEALRDADPLRFGSGAAATPGRFGARTVGAKALAGGVTRREDIVI